jgi:transposase
MGGEVSTMAEMDTKGAGRRNKHWPEALKREIVAATLKPGASVSVVARQYDVNANQVFAWRRRFRTGIEAPVLPPTPQLVPVTVVAEPAGGTEAQQARPAAETIEIEVSGTYRIRVGSGFDEPTLRRILDALGPAGGARERTQ